MKEATGELNVTVITVVAIAAVAAIFTVVLLPRLRANIANTANCSQATCPLDCTTATCTCTYIDESNAEQTVTCKNPYPENVSGGGATTRTGAATISTRSTTKKTTTTRTTTKRTNTVGPTTRSKEIM